MYSEITKIVQANYPIGYIYDITKTKYGSGNTYIISSSKGKFLAKKNERADFVRIYNRVQNVLSNAGFNMSVIIHTKADCLYSSDDLVLYEFIEGATIDKLSYNQMKNAIKYMNSFNKTLSKIPFAEDEIECKNHWDKAKSLDFILNDFEECYLNNSNFLDKEIIQSAISALRNHSSSITELGRQLIHSDLGADNFLFKADEVYAVIDFTPEYGNELYSLAQFTYWTVLWQDCTVSRETIEQNIVIQYIDENEKNIDIFFLLLLKAALYRFIAPFIDIRVNSNSDYTKLEKRTKIIDAVKRML